MLPRRGAALVLAVVGLTACASVEDAVVPPLAEPLLAISDAPNGGPAGFYFRPPIAPSTSYAGTFDPSLLPLLSVEECPIDATGACTGPTVVYTQSTTPALVLNAAVETYDLGWSPPGTGDFRLVVKSGATTLGFADIRVVVKGKDLKSVPAGFVGVVMNAKLPVKFRVETSAVASVTVAPTTAFTVVGSSPVAFAATVTDLHGATVVSPVVSWASSNPGVATVSSTGAATGISEGTATISATSSGVSGTASLEVRMDLTTVIGASPMVIPRADACGRSDGRTCESLVGDLVTDAMRAATGVDFAITNSGGLRTSLTCPTVDLAFDTCPPYTPPPYPITRGQVVAVMPFGNRVATIQVNGAELKTMLENGVSAMPVGIGGFPQVSGLCFTYDIQAPAGSRVVSAVRQGAGGSCTGTPIDLSPTGSYTIVENDFMAAGGDGYPDFSARAVFGDLLDRVVTNYIIANTPVAPSLQGRITCTSSGATACPVPLP